MADREEKLKAARDKLEKFRKKKLQSESTTPTPDNSFRKDSEVQETRSLSNYFSSQEPDVSTSFAFPADNAQSQLQSSAAFDNISFQQPITGYQAPVSIAPPVEENIQESVPALATEIVTETSFNNVAEVPYAEQSTGLQDQPLVSNYFNAAATAADIQSTFDKYFSSSNPVEFGAPPSPYLLQEPGIGAQSVGIPGHEYTAQGQLAVSAADTDISVINPSSNETYPEVFSQGEKTEITVFSQLSGEDRISLATIQTELASERLEKENLQSEIENLRKTVEETMNSNVILKKELESAHKDLTATSRENEESSALKNDLSKLRDELATLKDELTMKKSTLELVVAEKTELQSKSEYLEEQCRLIIQEKEILTREIEGLKNTCSEYKSKVEEKHTNNSQVEELTKGQTRLQDELEERRVENSELQGKLRRVCEEQERDKVLLKNLTSELEINKVHLIQLRSTGGETFNQEIQNLNSELQTTRNSLSAALASRDKLMADRDKLAEQYRNYSKDLASQAERVSEQLRRYQEENARLVHRESGLVGQIEQMEKQMQKYVQGGKNVTEEENSALKERCSAMEAELRQARDSQVKLEQMYTERSAQVEDTMKRLAQKEAKVIELQGAISGLETTNEMLRTDSGFDRNKAEILAAMESDKVAASRAMQQNAKLKLEIEELQKELVKLINSKAEVLDQLEDHKRKLENMGGAESEINGLQEVIREREVTISNMRNQIKYLESQINDARDHEVDKDGIIGELRQAQECIRSLNSINSELRSQIDVLSSRTRDCSESRSSSRREDSPSRSQSRSSSSSESPTSRISSSSESFVQVEKKSPTHTHSSDSFVEISKTNPDAAPPTSTTLGNNLREIVPVPTDNQVNIQKDSEQSLTPVIRAGTPSNMNGDYNQVTSPNLLDNLEAWRQLEQRFISAMNKIATLSSDKEQLEHLVTRLQDETETITDYIIMYQHQRKQQKMKIQEKDDQLQQLARDKANLQAKLSDLHSLVEQLVTEKPEVGREAVEETVMEGEGEKAPSTETTKIYKLLSEIQADSENMVTSMENFKPWFFDNNNSKVINV